MEESFVLQDTTQLLSRTPKVLRILLTGLSDEWVTANEGPETWSPFDIVGHLIQGERTDWIPRAKHILAGNADVPFEAFDRFAQFRDSEGKRLVDLLDEFEHLRGETLRELAGLGLTEAQLDLKGRHPELGEVTLRQLLATWVCHDLSHLSQVTRVMARRQTEAVGPWKNYLSILHR